MYRRYSAIIFGVGLTVAVAGSAGCGARVTGASGQGSGGQGSAGPVPATVPVASVRADPTPGGAGHGSCAAGGGHLVADPATPPAPVCLRVGEELNLSTPTSPLQPWQPFTSSDPQVLDCHPTPSADGAASAVCTARRPGSATVSTVTGPFSGDPHGPAQHMWQLTITVIG
jgi:hypothetical protein